MGVVTQLLSLRKGRMESWSTTARDVSHGLAGPSRGLIGFRTEFLTETRDGQLHHISTATSLGTESFAPDQRLDGGDRRDRHAYALTNLQERGACSSAPASRSTRA